MKNILFLLPVLLFLASCQCDETNPLANVDEITIPDAFLVTGLEYGAFSDGDNPDSIEAIIITFNRKVGYDSAIFGETVNVEGEDIFLVPNLEVRFNRIMLRCGAFYCLTDEGCRPTVRLDGLRSVDGEELDGDRDGKAGGIFAEEVAVDGCALPPFQVNYIYPSANDTITNNISNQLFISLSFSLPVDTNSAFIGENIRLISKPDNTIIPIDEFSWGSYGPYSLTLNILGPYQYCTYDPTCEFELIIEDSVRSQAGTSLDGDYDEKEGGDYIALFTILG